jgi:acetylornithine deacetylase/succinyl-diaminopimelate desuccinylase-like protein
MIEDVLRKCDELNEDAEARLRELLAIESVSTDPAYQPEIARAADWVKRALEQAGLEARMISGEGHPVVLAHAPAERVANPDAPPVLFYGHYDVQPPDPVEKWTSPPFEPTVRESVDGPAVFARGACDDKGQVMCFLEALRAYHEAGEKLPVPVTVLIEGEEECGSVGLAPLLEQHKDELAASVCLVSDTSMWDAAEGPKPAICYGLRGLLYFDLQLHGPARDLHSGVYGGTIPNPATEIVRVLGNLFDENHRVAIPGFYDDVIDADESEQARWDELGFDEQKYVESIGLKEPFGEAGRTTLERRWSRPSCDINGLYGGYMGEGGKTVIPTFAGIKVSFRLAAEQDPAKIAAAFRKWIESHDVGSLTWQITQHGQAYPVAVPTDSPQIQAVSRAVEGETGEPPAMVREGATIPVVADFKRVLGLDTILLGFGLNSDNIHSPDEHFALRRYHLGRRTYVRALAELAGASV